MKINIINGNGKLIAIIPIRDGDIDFDNLKGCSKVKENVNYIDLRLTDEDIEEPKKPFIWDKDTEDPILYHNGKSVALIHGRSKAVQNFVEKLSNDIGHKCDFSTSCGIKHIDVMAAGVEAVREKLMDENYMKQFIVPYSEESFNNETYFEIANIL